MLKDKKSDCKVGTKIIHFELASDLYISEVEFLLHSCSLKSYIFMCCYKFSGGEKDAMHFMYSDFSVLIYKEYICWFSHEIVFRRNPRK